MENKVKFSLVSTVLNEGDTLHRTIDALEAQTVRPDEIIVVDGGSRDNTYERLLQWANESVIEVRVYQENGCNVAVGRNMAIAKAKYNLIATTDFGCIHKPEWLASIITPFFEDPDLMVVGGNFSVLEDQIVSTSAKAEFILQNGFNLSVDEYFTVTSRSVAYKKNVWEALGGYPEWLTLAGDDSTFWKLIKRKHFKYRIVEDVNVYWTRHSTLKGFAKENFRYGLGDGESETNIRSTIGKLIRIVCRGSFLLALISILVSAKYLFLLVLFPFLIGFRPYLSAFKNWVRLRNSKFNFGVFIYSLYMLEILRFNYLKGFAKGYYLKNKNQQQHAKKLKLELA